MSDRVRIQVENHIATVTFNRPEKHNALDFEQFAAVIAAGESLRERSDVRAVVLHGAGPSFCAGLDTSSFAQGPALAQMAFTREPGQSANNAQRVALIWQQLPMPVIAALHGVVFGGGLQLALGADIRIARADAKLSVMEARWGLIPDMGITQTLTRLVGRDVAMDITLSAAVLEGSQAKALGLVTRIDDEPLAAAQALAGAIAEKSPDATRGIKKLYTEAWLADAKTGLELEATLQHKLLGSANQMEAVMAGMQKRAARFTDPV